MCNDTLCAQEVRIILNINQNILIWAILFLKNFAYERDEDSNC